MKVLTALVAGTLSVSTTGDMPPAQYQGEGAGYVIFADNVGQFCGDTDLTLSCMKRHPQLGPVAILPNPCAYDEEVFARMACREKARAFGWQE